PVGPLWWHRLRKPGCLNKATHHLWKRLLWRAANHWTNELRSKYLGLQPYSCAAEIRRDVAARRIVGVSDVLFSTPIDWPRNWHMTGAVLADDSEQPSLPADLEEFIRGGSPPIFIGFSSSPILDQEFWSRVVIPALKSLNLRAVVVSGWS